MTLPAIAGNSIFASDLYQLCQPSGGQEKGHYFLAGGCYTANAAVSCYIPSQSRNATPVSVSFDTADLAPAGGMNTIQTGQLTSGGFQIYCLNITGANTNPRAGGNYTIQY